MNSSVSSDFPWITYAEGLARFCGNEALYRRYLLRFPEDPGFSEMEKALAAKDYEKAFRCAHTLKGTTGNLSLTALFTALQPMVEYLRNAGDIPAALVQWKRLEEIYSQTIKAIQNL